MPKIFTPLTLVVFAALVARPALAADTPPLATLPQITNAAPDSTTAATTDTFVPTTIQSSTSTTLVRQTRQRLSTFTTDC